MRIGIIILILAIFTVGFIGWATSSTIDNIVNVCTCDEVEGVYVTSKYNWFLQEYKTISKCDQCGLPIE